jgi:hypothetical protein
MRNLQTRRYSTRDSHSDLIQEILTLVVKGVPAQVCENCGEEYADEATTARLLQMAEEVAQAGVQVDVRQYVAA